MRIFYTTIGLRLSPTRRQGHLACRFAVRRPLAVADETFHAIMGVRRLVAPGRAAARM